MKTKTTILTILLLSLSITLSSCKEKKQETAPPTPNPEPPAAQPGQAPDLTLKDLDGKEVSLSDHKGKIVVLEWFSEKCPFCRHHYETKPSIVDLAKKFEQKGVIWLSINSTYFQKTDQVKAYADKHSITFPILDDRDGKIGKLYKAERTPHMFIINKDSNIAYEGAIDNAPLGKLNEGQTELVNYVEKALNDMLTGKKITIPKTTPYGCTVKYKD